MTDPINTGADDDLKEQIKGFSEEQQKLINSIVSGRVNKTAEKKDEEIKTLKAKYKDVPADFDAKKYSSIPDDFDAKEWKKFKEQQKATPPEPPKPDDELKKMKDDFMKEIESERKKLADEREAAKAEALRNQLKSLGVDDKHVKFVGSELEEYRKNHAEKKMEELVEMVLKDNGLTKTASKGNGGKGRGDPPKNDKPKSMKEAIMQKMDELGGKT